MALDDFHGEPILGGTWLYDGILPRRIVIIARNYDIEYTGRQDDLLYGKEEDRDLDNEPDAPIPLGPDGRLYYVQNTSSPGHQTIDEVKAWAASQPWAPITWDR